MYGSDAITILDNCDSYVYLGGNNIDTAKSISIRLNVPVNEVLHMPVGREIVFRRRNGTMSFRTRTTGGSRESTRRRYGKVKR